MLSVDDWLHGPNDDVGLERSSCAGLPTPLSESASLYANEQFGG